MIYQQSSSNLLQKFTKKDKYFEKVVILFTIFKRCIMIKKKEGEKMKTTRKQLINFAIGLVKEVADKNKHIEVQYRKDAVILWFYDNNDSLVEGVYLYSHNSLKQNKQIFKKAILKIRGIIL